MTADRNDPDVPMADGALHRCSARRQDAAQCRLGAFHFCECLFSGPALTGAQANAWAEEVTLHRYQRPNRPFTVTADGRRDYGDRSAGDPALAITLSCAACRTFWRGCAAASDCPACGADCLVSGTQPEGFIP